MTIGVPDRGRKTPIFRPSETLLTLWKHYNQDDLCSFFGLLESAIRVFNYLGRKNAERLIGISSMHIAPKLSTLPSKLIGISQVNIKTSVNRRSDHFNEQQGLFGQRQHPAPSSASHRNLLDANLSSEISLITLDTICLFTQYFNDSLHSSYNSSITKRLFDIYLLFLRTNQSELFLKHLFKAFKLLIIKIPAVLFEGDTSLCGQFCYELLRLCNSPLPNLRIEASTLLFTLMKTNYQFTNNKHFIRVHVQTVKSVSQLLEKQLQLNSTTQSHIDDSLRLINNYAKYEKNVQFQAEVSDLITRIHTVIMSMNQLSSYEDNDEMYIDLLYKIAQSYTSTSELRKTWLECMARKHQKQQNYAEVGHCYLHIAALVAEYLKRREIYDLGCDGFNKISLNMKLDESSMKNDVYLQDIHYTMKDLIHYLTKAGHYLHISERYEILGEIFNKLIVPIHEQNRDYQALAIVYGQLQDSYSKAVDVNKSGKRLLGSYYKVAFYGKNIFYEHDKAYVYKEPFVTQLPMIRERLEKLYSAYGKVKMILDSNKV
ncbi:unnamed protein product, partial [Didymodactylos carnosus]